MDPVKRIWYLSPMRAAKVQASLRIRAVSPEPSLLAHTSSDSRVTFRQKARSQAQLNGWACAVEICHDGMLEDTNSLDGAHMIYTYMSIGCRHNGKLCRPYYTVCPDLSVWKLRIITEGFFFSSKIWVKVLKGNSSYKKLTYDFNLSPVKRICVFEHSVMTNFNCACPAI